MEDDLSEWVLRRLLGERFSNFFISEVFKQGGFGYLRKKVSAFNNMAKASPVLLLTDLDKAPCAPKLLEDWLDKPRHPNFLLRVAVREIEAWLLASEHEFQSFLGLRQAIKIAAPESLPDPKLELLTIALRSPRRDMREALVRVDSGGNLKQGPAYNSTLAEFVTQAWNSKLAEKKCLSLRKLLNALAALESSWKKRF